MNLIVTGPEDFWEAQLVTHELNLFTFDSEDVVLVSDKPISFQPAHYWMAKRWMRSRTKRKTTHAVVRFHYLSKTKNRDTAYKTLWRDMVQDATHLIAFWDTGNVDFKTQGLWDMAETFDLVTKKILV